ncbi:hypothetical protein ACTXT7_004144 [Hymenolepis weldensis]
MNMETENLYISSLQLYAESLVHQIGEFHYELEADQIFINWFGKCGDIFRNDLVHVPDEEKCSADLSVFFSHLYLGEVGYRAPRIVEGQVWDSGKAELGKKASSVAAKTLKDTYGNDVVIEKTCRGWFSRFKKDNFSLKDERRTASRMLKKLNSEQL